MAIKNQSQNSDDFQTFFNTVDDFLFVLDLSGNIMHFNPVVPKCLGYTNEEISSMCLADIHSADYKEEVGAILVSIQDGKTVECHIPLQAKDGRLIPVETKIIGGRWSGEHAFFGVSRDVTTHKEIEKALRESEERLELAIQGADLGIFDWNIQTGEMIRNNRWAEIFGYTLEEIEPTLDFWEKLIHPDDLPQVKQIMDDFLEEKTTFWEAEYCAWTKSGELVWIQDRGKIAEWDEANRPLRATGTLLEFTKRKRAEETLRESEELFRATFRATAGGVLVVSDTGEIIHVNPQFIEMFGVTDELIRTQDSQKLLEYILDQLKEPDEFHSKTLELRKSPTESSDVILFKDGRVFERIGGPLILERKTKGRVWSFRNITERKRAEEALRMSEKRYRDFITHMPEGMSVSDLDDRIVLANQAFAEVFGYEPAELIGRSIGDLIDPDEIEKLTEQTALRKVGTGSTYRIRIIRKDQESRIIRVSAVPSRDQDGNIEGTVAVITDITERVRAEEALRRSEQRYRELITYMPEGMVVADLEEEILLVNKVFAGTLGYEPEELVGMNLRKLIEEDQLEKIVSETTRRRRGEASSYRLKMVRRNGETRIILVSALPTRDDDGVVNGTVAVVTDITERVQAEEALRESEKRYRLLADNVSDVIWIVDMNLRFTYISPSVKQVFGYTIEEAMSKSIDEIMTRDSFEAIMTEFAEALALENTDRYEGAEGAPMQIEMYHQDGSRMWAEFSRSFLRDGGDTPIGILGVARDITERKRAEETQERERKAFSIIAEAAVHATTVSDLCHRVLDEVIEVLEFDVGAVRLYDEQAHLLELVAVVGMSEEEVKNKASAQSLEDSTTVVPIVTHTRKDIFGIDLTTPDTQEDPKLKLDELETRLVISWPIQGADQDLLGVILLMAYTPKEVLEKDRTFFDTTAGVFATVLERRRAQEKLRESEERFVLFADHLPGPLYIKDHDSKVLFVNRFMRIISGDDWVGRTNFDLFPIEVAKQLTAEEQRVITDGPIETIERRQAENGSIQTFQSLKFPIFRAGNPPLIGGFSIDITRQKTAEELLERAVARAEFFNDLMVHDLNNMHQGIMSSLELILVDTDLSSSSTDFAKRALEQTRRSVTLVGNVRKLSRVDREQVELSRIYPHSMLVTAIEMVKNSFPKKEISLNTNIVEGGHPVLADEFLLDIFYNLIHNSMNADPSNEVILDILATPSDEAGFMKIVFKDRGPGISDEMKETILSRLDGGGPHGWGLGLTLVKRIIDRYGGKVWIEDRVEGDHKQGACIVILLVDASEKT